MTGTIDRIAVQGTFCFIKADGRDWYANIRDFVDPAVMRMNQTVTFRPKLAGPPEPGKPHPVTDVIAA